MPARDPSLKCTLWATHVLPVNIAMENEANILTHSLLTLNYPKNIHFIIRDIFLCSSAH